MYIRSLEVINGNYRFLDILCQMKGLCEANCVKEG